MTLSVTFLSELCHIWHWEHFDESMPSEMLKLFLALLLGFFYFVLFLLFCPQENAAQHRHHRVLDTAMVPDLAFFNSTNHRGMVNITLKN